jgi:YggT family protein
MSTLTEILVFIIHTLGSLYITLVLLRFLLQLVRADYYNPVSKAIVKLTDPLLLPLRKIIPGLFGWDVASLVLAVILQLLLAVIILLLRGYGFVSPFQFINWAIIELINNVLTLYFFAMLVLVIASWIAPHSYNPALQLIRQLLDPLLRPIQRVLPNLGGLDFSPLVFLMLLHIVRSYLLPVMARGMGVG